MLSKTTQRKRQSSKQKLGSNILKKAFILLLIVGPITYGVSNIIRLKPEEPKKEELKVEMGDQPVEKKLNIVITADGGLNFRKDPDVGAEKIGTIPDGTKLEAKQELEGWYNVDFDGKNGWISKEFAVLEEEVKPDITEEWLNFTSDLYAFTAKYPRDWSYRDYGLTLGGESLGFVAFSFSELPVEIPSGSPLFVPIEVKLSTTPQAELQAAYDTIVNKTVFEVEISGIKGVKYVYTDSSDNTEKTKIFFTHKEKAYIISENGGYGEDLEKFLTTFVLK